MWLICGLGNPGKKYQNTRHNVGFQFVDEIIKKNNFKLIKKNKSKEIYRGLINDNECLLCKPIVFMNLSGSSIQEVVNFYKILKSNIIVVHDDLDLPVGKIKIKRGGGNGGHNGLLSIDNTIGVAYNRLRIGIGHPGLKELVNRYVLQKFKPNEKKIITKIIKLTIKDFHLLFDNKTLFLSKLSPKLKELINGI